MSDLASRIARYTLKTTSQVYFAIIDSILAALVARDDILRPILPYAACFVFVYMIEHLILLARTRTFVKIFDMALIFLWQRACVYAGVLPVSIFYDTLICALLVVLTHAVIVAILLLHKLSESHKRLDALILDIVDMDPVVQQAFLELAVEFRNREGIFAHDDEGDDNNGNGDEEEWEDEEDEEDEEENEDEGEEGRFAGMFGVKRPRLAIYRPMHHRHGLYRFRESAGAREIGGKYILDPIDADINKPFLFHIRDKDDQHCTICWDDIGATGHVTILPCDHSFHQLCVREWFKNNFSCPQCTTEFEWHPAVRNRRRR